MITYIVFDVEKNDKDPKFKTVDHYKDVKIQKYFCKRIHTELDQKKFLWLKMLRTLYMARDMVINSTARLV